MEQDRDGRPSLHLFEIDENEGQAVNENLLQAALSLRDKLLPGVRLQDINWQISMGHQNSHLRFEEAGGHLVRIDFDNGLHFGSEFKDTLSSYEAKVASGKMQTTDDGFGRSVLTIVPVTLPEHPLGHTLMKQKHNEWQENEIVLVDSQKFLAAWKAQTGPLSSILDTYNISARDVHRVSWGSGHDAVLFESSVEQSVSHIHGQSTSSAVDMAELSYFPDEPMRLSNGRHRIFNAINAGAPFVPISMDSSARTELFKQRFQWHPQECTPAPEPEPEPVPTTHSQAMRHSSFSL